jgi:putative ABC transport system permease protein
MSLLARAPIRYAVRSFRARRLESLLLLLALAASYAAAGAVLAVLGSFRARVEEDLARVGWNVINVHANPDWKKFLTSILTGPLLDELAALAGGEAAPAVLETVLVGRDGEPPAASPGPAPEAGSGRHPALAIGTSPSWASMVELRLVEGRFFDRGERDACVLDQWVARRVFGGEPAAGRRISAMIGGKDVSLRVVGVAEDPFRIRERFGDVEGTGGARNVVFRMMEYKNVYLPREALGAEKPILLGLISLGPGREPRKAVLAIRERLAERGSTAMAWDRRRWAKRIIGATAEISGLASFLWVAILAIMALMTAVVLAVAVRGRFREIAIRRMEGARRGEVLSQLLWENGILSLAAGAAGLLLSKPLCLWIEESVLGWPIDQRPRDLLLVLATGVALALVTTVLPAHRAASAPPVEALRKA